MNGPPTTTAAVTSGTAGDNGWYRSDVGVTLSAANGGVEISEIHYNVNGGADQTVSGSTAVASVSTEGASNVITYYAVNVYGGRESDKTFTVKIDKTAPSISANPDRDPNSDGWYNDNMTAIFRADDDVSGVASLSSPAILGEGADQSVTGTATDYAGNTASCTVNVNIDKTLPAVSASLSGPKSSTGWYDGDVTLTVLASDSLSGVSSVTYSLDGNTWKPYTGPVIVPLGLARPLYYRVVDKAGNANDGSIFVYFPPKSFTFFYNQPLPSGSPTPATTPTPGPEGTATPSPAATPAASPSPAAVTEPTQSGYSLQMVIMAVLATSVLSGLFSSLFMYYLCTRPK